MIWAGCLCIKMEPKMSPSESQHSILASALQNSASHIVYGLEIRLFSCSTFSLGRNLSTISSFEILRYLLQSAIIFLLHSFSSSHFLIFSIALRYPGLRSLLNKICNNDTNDTSNDISKQKKRKWIRSKSFWTTPISLWWVCNKIKSAVS